MVTSQSSRFFLPAGALLMVAVFFLALPAQAQTFSQGVPASVSSPGPGGQPKGVPASVVTPVRQDFRTHASRPVFRMHGPLRRFGNPREHGPSIVVPVPIFYPIYYGDGNPADPYVPAQPGAAPVADAEQYDSNRDSARASDEELRQAYLQGAREALEQERASHRSSTVAEEKPRPRTQAADEMPRRKRIEEPAPPPKEDNSPTTVFIFKDGRKIETRNYAIMGQTLYDLSSTVLKKVSLADLDKVATLKENDDRGIQLKLP